MKAEKLFVLLGEAGEPWMGEPKHRFRFPAAVAALLVVVLILPLVMIGTDKQEVGPAATLIWQGRIYELVERSDRLDLGPLDATRVGGPVGTGVLETDGEQVILHEYRQSDGRAYEALLAVADETGWQYAVFCNYIIDPQASGAPTAVHEPRHLLSLYGVSGPEDIVSLRADGRESDRKAELLSALLDASYYSEEIYQNKVYGGLSEVQQQEKSRSLADNHVALRLETSAGLVFWMGYQPETGFIDWCLGHYLVG